MGRLTELLLNEDSTPKYTNIDGLKYVKYSNKVNLLRILLMMETLTDFKQFPTKQKFEKILALNSDLETLTKLKGLATSYTPIVTALKKGKKASEIKTLKEKFYKKFFPILLSGLNINLNSLTLTNIFAKSKHGDLNKLQIKYILKLIKVIQEEELTQKDKQELLTIKSSLTDEIEEEIPSETETAKTSLKDIAIKNLEKKFEGKSNEELLKKVEEIDLEIDSLTSVKSEKESEQIALEQEFNIDVISLDEYISAKFNFVKNNPEISDKIIETQNLLKQTLSKQEFSPDEKKSNKVKKVITTMVADVMDGMTKHIPNFISNSNLVPEIIYHGGPEIMLKLTDPEKTEDEFNFVRSIKLGPDGNIDKIKHEYFVLPPEAQGSGVSKEAIADSLRLYKAAGVNKIELHANIGLGGYVWLRYGFRPYPEQIENIKASFVDITKSVRYGLKGGVQAGVSADMAINGLINHFKDTGLDTYLTELKSKLIGLSEKIKKLEDELGFDSDFGDEKMILSTSFNDIVANQLEVVGEKISSTFEFSLATLSDDISLKSFNVNLSKKVKLEIDFSSKLSSLPPRMHQQEADRIGKVLKNEIDPTIKVNKKGKAVWTIELSNTKVKIPVKKWFTITGINVGDNKELQAFPAGNDVTGEVWSLNWKGSLDLNDPVQYNKALEYATIK